MKDRKEELTVENGGKGIDNVRTIWRYIEELFSFEYRSRSAEGWTPTYNEERVELWDKIKEIDCTNFYMPDGAKITRPIKGMLEAQFGKALVKLKFAEFCKRVGNLYAEVKATAHLRKTYFSDTETGVESFGDDGSCFRPCGQNKAHGKLIDISPCTGVITITPDDARYAAGRIIVWFKSPSMAHLINKYSKEGARELPHSIYVRALEKLTDTELSYRREDGEECGTLDIWINNEPVICTVTGKKNFSSVVKSFKLACSSCGELYSTEDNRTPYCGECSSDDGYAHCHVCGERVDEDDAFSHNDNTYCEDCFRDRFFFCESCSEDCDLSDAVKVYTASGRTDWVVCSSCAEHNYFECVQCERLYPNDCEVNDHDGNSYCEHCAEEHTFVCDECSERIAGEPDEEGRCEECHEESEEKAS